MGKFDGTVNDCSIWSRIELPTLLDGGIGQITLIDYTNFQNRKDYPQLSSPVKPRDESAQDYCFDWEGDREDPADPDSEPPIGLPYYPGSCGVHVQQVSFYRRCV